MPRCPNGTRRNKKTGLCKRKRCHVGTRKNRKTQKCEPKKIRKITPLLPPTPESLSTRLTKEEIDAIIIETGANPDEVRVKLENVTFDPNYVSAFTGNPVTNLYAQAVDKVFAWRKYGDVF